MACHNNKQNEPEQFTVELVSRDCQRDQKLWSIIWSFSTGGLLIQVNYSENYTFGTAKLWSIMVS